MKKFKSVITLILSCVLVACTLALFAACKVKENEEGRFSKHDYILGIWYGTVPNPNQGGTGDLMTEKYYNYRYFVTIEYEESVSNTRGYKISMATLFYSFENEAILHTALSSRDIVTPEPADMTLEDNQYYYSGKILYPYTSDSGFYFNLINPGRFDAVSIQNDENKLEFLRTDMTLEDFYAMDIAPQS